VPIVLSLLALLLLATPAHAGSWRRPVDGALLEAFHIGRNPYAAGQHRGVDLAAPLGSAVRSACSGRVSFSGRLPGGGLTVSTRCGSLIATYQHLATAAVTRGEPVAAGARLGTVGRSGRPRGPAPHVHLGVREAASGRYLDPLSLFGVGAPGLPPALGPAPRGRPPRSGPSPARPRPRPGRAPLLRPGRVPVGAPLLRPGRVPVGAPLLRPGRVPVGALLRPGLVPVGAPLRPGRVPVGAPLPGSGQGRPLARGPLPPTRLPWTVWAGLACVGLGLPLGGLVHRRRRRHALATARVARSA
jgi:murein DD-endopeptidase MepM/ murein hydrolase activator NlpD